MKKLGPYELFETLGAGAMSMVYRALETPAGRTVAVKVLHPYMASAANIARFEREVHVLSAIKHPNIVELYDFSNIDGGKHFSVLEFVEGHNLSELLGKEREIHPDIAAMVVLQLAGGLAVAHSKGVIHRDLKPENILVRKDGVLKISDFGLAYFWEGTDLTAAGTRIGSPAYMSPEQIRGEKPSPRMDVFSLGILFYLMLTGELPFQGRTRRETFEMILKITPPAPTQLVGQTPAKLSEICMLMLGKAKGARIDTAEEVVQRLEDYLASVGLADYEPVVQRFLSGPRANREEVRKELVNAYIRMGARALEKNETSKVVDLFRGILVLTGVAALPQTASEESQPTKKIPLPRRALRSPWVWIFLIVVLCALAAFYAGSRVN